MPLLFGLPGCSHTTKYLCDLPGLEPGKFSVTHYDNQEFRAAVDTPVNGEQCFLVGSVTPPECRLLFCTDTVSVCATMPDLRITVLPAAPVLREKLMRASYRAQAAS